MCLRSFSVKDAVITPAFPHLPARPHCPPWGRGRTNTEKAGASASCMRHLTWSRGPASSTVDPKPWHGHGGGDMARQRPTLSLPF